MKILKKTGRTVEANVTDAEIDRLIRAYVHRRIGAVKSLTVENGLVVVVAEIAEPPKPSEPRKFLCCHAECAAEYLDAGALEVHCRTEHGTCGVNVSGYGPCERPLGHADGHRCLMFAAGDNLYI